jgi:hypothetical protein
MRVKLAIYGIRMSNLTWWVLTLGLLSSVHRLLLQRPDDRTNLIVDAGVQEITLGFQPVKLTGQFYGSQEQATEVCLGEIRTDELGRLIFIGGAGYSRCVANPKKPHFQPDVISEFDSIDWIDDTCDGWVDVKVVPPQYPLTAGIHGVNPTPRLAFL